MATCAVCCVPIDDSYMERIVRVWEEGNYDGEGGRVTTKIRTCADCYPAKCVSCSRVMGGYDITCTISESDNGCKIFHCHGCMLGIPSSKIPKNRNEYDSEMGLEYSSLVGSLYTEYAE